MSYIALYREWRPKVFNDIVGQEHITRILKNQIKQGRVAHAYLFCGTRGTGKTTTAKVLSKAINCLHPVDGEPCGVCEICTGIDNGSVMDVIEIDAASNNGVDNIRELRDDVKYLPSKCKYKAYIIDEVHMLSTAAFNALLKTLEEPPAHIVFILATTEYQKVPATILSRCQRFDFKRIKVSEITERLKRIAREDGISVDDRALNMIARSADGAMRDALSIFDQCISLSGGTVSYDDVSSILGITTDEYLIKVTDAIAAADVPGCISLIDELIVNGKDVYQFIKDLTMHFRNLLIRRMGDSSIGILNMSEEAFEGLKAQTKKFSTERILRNINILSAAENDAKWVSQPRIILEMAVFKMCRKELDNDIDSLLCRVAKLESMLEGKKINIQPKEDKEPENKERKKTSEQPVTEKKEEAVSKKQETPSGVSFENILKKWPEIVEAINKGGYKLLYSHIIQGKPMKLSDNTLTIGFDNPFAKKLLDEADKKAQVENYISSVCGLKLRLHCVMMDEAAIDKQQDDEDIVKKAASIFGDDLIEVEE